VFSRENAFLSGMIAYEGGDKPCRFTLTSFFGEENFTLTRSLQLCNATGSQKRIDLDPNRRQAVRRIQVCMNRADTRVKGVRLFGAEPDAQGRFQPVSATVSFHRTNCHHWAPPVSCPGKKVAAGVRFEHDNGAVTGMGLMCVASKWLPENASTLDSTSLQTTGPATVTDFSGSEANDGQIMSADLAPGTFMHGINVRERRDSPCWASLQGWSFGGPRAKNIELCKQPGYASEKRANVEGNSTNQRAITGLQVCLNAAGTRLKGVRVWGGAADESGVFHADGSSDTARRTNCSWWKDRVDCPAGQAAVGLRARKSGNAINGLALVCKSATR